MAVDITHIEISCVSDSVSKNGAAIEHSKIPACYSCQQKSYL